MLSIANPTALASRVVELYDRIRALRTNGSLDCCARGAGLSKPQCHNFPFVLDHQRDLRKAVEIAAIADQHLNFGDNVGTSIAHPSFSHDDR